MFYSFCTLHGRMKKTSQPTSLSVHDFRKEEIGKLRFPSKEVLSDESARERRRHLLEEGVKLGNLEKGKLKLTFMDNEGIKKVYTTIWAVGDRYVSLKRGTSIPICRIISVVMP